MNYDILRIKAKLLAGRTVRFSAEAQRRASIKVDRDNHHRDEFVFLRMSPSSRVRLVIDNDPCFLVDAENDSLVVKEIESGEIIARDIELEESVVHAPEQLFLGLYEYCKIGCKFCPFGGRKQDTLIHYSLDSMYEDIDNSKGKKYTSVGITTAIPYHLSSDDVADEMVFAVRKVREKVGEEIPIGISTRIPSYDKLLQMKEAGASEARLNIEVPTQELARKLMPNKPTIDIFTSLEAAVRVFGIGKVSSNIVIGIGETDEEVIDAVDRLGQIGVIATLYPYDPFVGGEKRGFIRPDEKRLYRLAIEHKNILDKYGLDPNTLLTMCPSCAASHILPGKDL